MSRRIITTENLEEDVKIESHLRPQLLDDYIGQEKAKEILKVYIAAAKERIAAISPGFSIAGPDVILIFTCISLAIIPASVVLPRPGGP